MTEIDPEIVEKAVNSMTTPHLRTLLLAAGGDLEANLNITRAIARAALLAVLPDIIKAEREKAARIALEDK